MITASVGLPATAHAWTPLILIRFARIGSKIEIERPDRALLGCRRDHGHIRYR